VSLSGTEVSSCNPQTGKYGDYSGSSGGYKPAFYSHLDASKHPTLSTKIKHVLADHYKMVGHSGGWNQEGFEGNLGQVVSQHGHGGSHHHGHAVSHHEEPNHVSFLSLR